MDEPLGTCSTSEKRESLGDFLPESFSGRRESFLEFLMESDIPKITEDENETESASKGCISWKGIKVVIFIICLTMFILKLTGLYIHYFDYPFTTKLDVLKRDKVKIPAITICNRNPFHLSKFCSNNSRFCEAPNNLAEFCLKHPQICKRNITELKLPKLGYYTSPPTRDILEFLHNSSQVEISDEEDDFLESVKDYRNIELKGTSAIEVILAADISNELKRYVKCYSVNLHLTDNEEREIWPTDDPNLRYEFYFKLKPWDLFFPWMKTQIYYFIHNSFVPLNPLQEGDTVEPGYFYNINVILWEMNLLPEPYQTKCVDYDAMWEKNNRSGPRSQEMCKDLCYLSYDRYCFGCDLSTIVIETPENLCPLDPQPIAQDIYCFNKSERVEHILQCTRKCEKDCVKLKYDYFVSKMESKPNLRDKDEDIIKFVVNVRGKDTILMNYKPLYGLWELFGYTGGVIGCWLGISVWTLVGIIEKLTQKVICFK